MKVLERDDRHRRLKLLIENPEDLYFLSLLIDEGDLLSAWTSRQIKVERGFTVERGERVRVQLTILVKKVEFQRFSDSLRVLGVVVDAPEWIEARGLHHTIGVRPGDEVGLVKRALLKHHEQVLQLSTSRVKVVGVVSLEVDEVAAALLRPQGLEVLAAVSLPRPSKEGSLREQLLSTYRRALPPLVEALRSKGVSELLVLAPHLAREAALACLKDVNYRYIEVSEGGLSGLYELMRRDDFRQILRELLLLPPKQALGELLKQLERDPGKVAIGLEEVARAAELRAVRKLLVLDEALLGEKRPLIMSVLERASETAEDVVVVPSSLEEAELIKRGGVAALLYWLIDARDVR